MATADSATGFIKRNRPPRVQISYADPIESNRQVELPFVMGVMADLAVKFTLASLTFVGMSAGAAPFSITINSLSDAFGGPITATATLGSATIAAVPEPSTWTLSVAGLAIVALVARLRDPRLTPLRRRVGPIGGFSCVKSRA